MDRHCENARAVVELLQGHDKVTHVLYPGLSDHPGHDAAARQMKDFGGMVSFRVAGGADAAMRLTTTTQVFSLAESLGAVESLIEHPGVMTTRPPPGPNSRCQPIWSGSASGSSRPRTFSTISVRHSIGSEP